MPRERPVKGDSLQNGDNRGSSNGPGSVPPRSSSTGQPNFPPNSQQVRTPLQSHSNEAELVELFSPVSEPSNVAPGGMFEEQHLPNRMMSQQQQPPHSDMPMSPFPQGNPGQMMMGPNNGGSRPQMPPGNMFPGGNMPRPMGPGMMHGPGIGPGGMPPNMGPHPNMMHHMMPMAGPPLPGRVYPQNQPMIYNQANPNAPPIYPCGFCHKEIRDNDQGILCESGCNFWFHRNCAGLTENAYLFLTKEVYVEWVCDNCLRTKDIPLIKIKS